MDSMDYGQKIITSEDIREKFPGLPDEYYFYLQRYESSLVESKPYSVDNHEHTGCNSTRFHESRTFSIQQLDFGTARSHATGGDFLVCNANDDKSNNIKK